MVAFLLEKVSNAGQIIFPLTGGTVLDESPKTIIDRINTEISTLTPSPILMVHMRF
jgi:hypothetical protein